MCIPLPNHAKSNENQLCLQLFYDRLFLNETGLFTAHQGVREDNSVLFLCRPLRAEKVCLLPVPLPATPSLHSRYPASLLLWVAPLPCRHLCCLAVYRLGRTYPLQENATGLPSSCPILLLPCRGLRPCQVSAFLSLRRDRTSAVCHINPVCYGLPPNTSPP